MIRVILLCLFLLVSPLKAQEFPDLPVINSCAHPENKDKWGIRRPTLEEAEQMGSHVLIFEYWNNTASCSASLEETISYNGFDFNLSVSVGGQGDSRETIILTPGPNTPYVTKSSKLTLEDGEKPGSIILDPLLM